MGLISEPKWNPRLIGDAVLLEALCFFRVLRQGFFVGLGGTGRYINLLSLPLRSPSSIGTFIFLFLQSLQQSNSFSQQISKLPTNPSPTMFFSTLLVVATATLGLATPTPPTAPNPNDIFIQSFTYAGSGCPAGSVANATNASKQVLTLLFDNYVASIGPGTLPADHRKNCQMNLDIHYPHGWQYSLFTADYRGFEDLDKGVTGQQVATYYFSGQQQQVRPMTRDY
jgi:hypothetical protein